MKGTSCEYCANYTYDEECDEYYCDVNLDVIQSNGKNRAEGNAIRQMRVFHEKECEFCGKSAF